MASIFTCVIGLLLTISSILGGKFIDNYGRKIILIIGELICIVNLFILSIIN